MTLLWERFREFAKDTEMIGSERVNGVNDIADSLISSGHTGKDQLYSFLHCTGALKNYWNVKILPYTSMRESDF